MAGEKAKLLYRFGESFMSQQGKAFYVEGKTRLVSIKWATVSSLTTVLTCTELHGLLLTTLMEEEAALSLNEAKKESAVNIKINPWALARLNAEGVSKAAALARKKSRILQPIVKQESVR